MEQEEMKACWRFMEQRLEKLEMDNLRLAHENVKSKVRQLRERLLVRLGFVVLLLPFLLHGMSRAGGIRFGRYTWAAVAVFVAAMAVRQVAFWLLLERIDPVTMTVRELLLAESRFRLSFKAGVLVGVVLAAAALAGMIHDITAAGDPVLTAGVWSGLAVGVVLGVRVFIRAWRGVGELRRAIAELR